MSYFKKDLIWNKPKKTKKPVDKTWSSFSKYIRLRDCLKTTGTNTILKCCSCPRICNLKNSDAWHFISRTYLIHKYNLINVNGQCITCNRFQQGQWTAYFDFLVSFFWRFQVDNLIETKNQLCFEKERDHLYWNSLRKLLEKKFINWELGRNQLEVRATMVQLIKTNNLESFLKENIK